jgi:Tfp pilus assembly protein PilF
MFSFSRAAIALAIILPFYTGSHAQSLGGVNTSGTAGNEVIQGKIHFPRGYDSGMRPVVKLQSYSSSELTTVADFDGTFGFTHLKPDSYTIIVNGGNEFENAVETVTVGHGGPVPAQANPGQYAIPSVYQVQIYLQPKGVGVYNERGVQYLKLGQAEKAAKEFAEALKIAPEDFTARLNYGIALLNQKKFAEAEKQLRRAIQINAESATSHYYLGLALMNERQFQPAQSEFEISIKNSNDKIAAAHKYLGGIYWRNKEYGRAADELTRYLELDPKAADAAKTRDTIKDLRSKK